MFNFLLRSFYMTQETKQKDGYETTLTSNEAETFFWVCRRKINPKTGKGWQAGKNLFRGEDKAKAFRAFLYA